MSRRDSTYFSEGQQPGGAQDGFDSSDDGLGSSMHLSPSFMGGFVQEDSRRGSNYYGSDHGALASSGILPNPEGSQGKPLDTTAAPGHVSVGSHQRRSSQSSQFDLQRTGTQDSLANYFDNQRRPSASAGTLLAGNRAPSPLMHRRGMLAHQGPTQQPEEGTRGNDRAEFQRNIYAGLLRRPSMTPDERVACWNPATGEHDAAASSSPPINPPFHPQDRSVFPPLATPVLHAQEEDSMSEGRGGWRLRRHRHSQSKHGGNSGHEREHK